MILDPLAVLMALYRSEPENRFPDGQIGPAFDPPLVAVADAADPWFRRIRDLIGAFHWTPQEALALVAPRAVARSIICWCLPIARAVRQSNRARNRFPSRPWAYTRTLADRIIARMGHGLEDHLRGLGHAAVAPAERPENVAERRCVAGWSSRWSERHVAFIAGMGTFGLSGGLITPRGVAHRLGSVVTDADLPATSRPYGDDPFAWCLGASGGGCGACIARCPAGAIGRIIAARDKEACWRQGQIIRQHGPALYGWEGRYGCGFCQTAVPCEDRNPRSGR